jgi:hypothetical protein
MELRALAIGLLGSTIVGYALAYTFRSKKNCRSALNDATVAPGRPIIRSDDTGRLRSRKMPISCS